MIMEPGITLSPTLFILIIGIVAIAAYFIGRMSRGEIIEITEQKPKRGQYSVDVQEALNDAEFQQEAARGHKIAAIKRLRELTGLGLKEAKETTEQFMRDHGF